MQYLRLMFTTLTFLGTMSVAAAQEPPRLELVVQTKRTPNEWPKAALSGDGNFAATYDGTTAMLWDCATGRKIRVFQGHAEPILSIALSADAKHLVTGSRDKTAILWDATTGKKRQTFPGQATKIHGVAVSGDGKRVASGGSQCVSLWDGDSGEKLHTFEGLGHWIADIAITPDGKYVVAAAQAGDQAILWDVASGKQLQAFEKAVWGVGLSRDGKRVVLAERDGKASLRETQTGKAVHIFAGHRYWVSSVALSADGKYALTAGSDNLAILRDAQTGKDIRTFGGHSATISDVALSDDGARALTMCENNTAYLWDTASGKKLQTFQEYADVNAGVALSGDGKTLGVAGVGVSLLDLASGKKIRTLRGKNSYFHTVALSGDGQRVLAGSQNEEAILWDTATGNQLRTFPGFDSYFGPRVCVALTDDARRVAIVSLGWAHLWDAARGEKLGTVRHPDRDSKLASQSWYLIFQYNSAALSSDGKRIALCEIEKSASLWDLASGKKIQSFEGHTSRVRSVAFSGDDKVILTGSEDGTACLWDAATGKKLRTFAKRGGIVVALSADGKRAVTAREKNVTLWDATNGDKLHTLVGHTDDVVDMVLSRDGKHLWTAAADRSVRLWDLTTGKERCRIHSFNMGDDWLVVTPDGRFDGSPRAGRFVAYREPGTLKLFHDDATLKRFHRPGLLADAWNGEK